MDIQYQRSRIFQNQNDKYMLRLWCRRMCMERGWLLIIGNIIEHDTIQVMYHNYDYTYNEYNLPILYAWMFCLITEGQLEQV